MVKKMANLTLIERLQLVKAGYKAKDIEKMIIEDASEPSASEEPADNTSKGEAEPEQVKEEAETFQAEETKDEPDYKSMFEEMQKQYDEIASKLEAAQKANINTDVSKTQPKISTSETINNIFREVIS